MSNPEEPIFPPATALMLAAATIVLVGGGAAIAWTAGTWAALVCRGPGGRHGGRARRPRPTRDDSEGELDTRD